MTENMLSEEDVDYLLKELKKLHDDPAYLKQRLAENGALWEQYKLNLQPLVKIIAEAWIKESSLFKGNNGPLH